MTTAWIIEQIDQQFTKLQEARGLLLQAAPEKAMPLSLAIPRNGRRKRRKLSAEARARIVAAQKLRWTKSKKKS